MRRRTARGNRIGMLIVGLVLAAAGAAALARGLAIRPALLGPAHAPVTDPQTRRYAADHGYDYHEISAVVGIGLKELVRKLAALVRHHRDSVEVADRHELAAESLE